LSAAVQHPAEAVRRINQCSGNCGK
jgi:hypothetical protein